MEISHDHFSGRLLHTKNCARLSFTGEEGQRGDVQASSGMVGQDGGFQAMPMYTFPSISGVSLSSWRLLQHAGTLL